MRRSEYFICGSQRSGSNVLCEALSISKVAGRPTEHFVPTFPGAQALGHRYAGFEQSEWAQAGGIETFQDFFKAILSEGSTPNGVFGTKLMWNALVAFLDKLAELPVCRGLDPVERLPAAFPQARFIHLRRRNRVRQAVSWALAAQTGNYASHQQSGRMARAEAEFDLQLLDHLYAQIHETEVGWEAFFKEQGAEPLHLWYEDLSGKLESTVTSTISWLGVHSVRELSLSGLQHQPQATELNTEWEARFRAARLGL